MLKKLQAYFRPPSQNPLDRYTVVPTRQNRLLDRLFHPRTDNYHIERSPSGNLVEFMDGHAPGQHITGAFTGGPEGWFKYDRIDPTRAHGPLLPTIHWQCGPLRLNYNKSRAAGFRQTMSDADQIAVDHLVARYQLKHLPEADRTRPTGMPPQDPHETLDSRVQRLVASQFAGLKPEHRFDLVMPILARAALAQARQELANTATLPPMHLTHVQMRDVGNADGRVMRYRAVEATFLSIRLTPEAAANGWKIDESPSNADMQAPREVDGWLHIPVFGRCKVLEDGRLVMHTFDHAERAAPVATV